LSRTKGGRKIGKKKKKGAGLLVFVLCAPSKESTWGGEGKKEDPGKRSRVAKAIG